MTAYATDTFNGDGSTVEFTIDFDFIQRDHVKVYRVEKANNAETELTVIAAGDPGADEYVWEADKRIRVGTAPTDQQQLKVQRDTPEDQQLVQWKDGSYIVATDLNTSDKQWLYGLQELEDKFSSLSTSAIKYFGAIDLTVDPPPALPVGGMFYINTGSGLVLADWTGIGGDAVVGSEQVIYNDTKSEWEIFKVPSSQAGVLQVNATAPITVDSTDTQRPVVGITNATASADGAMSSADKDKLDNIAPGAEVNVNADWNATSGDAEILNKPTIPAAQVNSDWDATSGVAEILNKPTVIDGDAPSDGKTYGRKDAAWSEVEPGGVTKIKAGSNVTISPTGGTGEVTINATGGGDMPTGGGGEDAFYENTTVIDNDYSITAGSNAGTFGPVTVNGEITVPDGSTWTVVGGGEGGGGGFWTRDGTTLKPANDGDDVEIKSTSNPQLTVTRDGSGNAAAGLVLGNNDQTYVVNADASGLALFTDTSNRIYFDHATGNVGIGGTLPTTPNIILRADGSINAAGRGYFGALDDNSDNTSGTNIFETGGVYVQRTISNQSDYYRAYKGKTVVWRVQSGGSTSFSNAIINLDPDNSANYVTTTNAEGETEAVYNGPTLDVKALLLEFQAKIETLEAAKASLEARLSTLEGGN